MCVRQLNPPKLITVLSGICGCALIDRSLKLTANNPQTAIRFGLRCREIMIGAGHHDLFTNFISTLPPSNYWHKKAVLLHIFPNHPTLISGEAFGDMLKYFNSDLPLKCIYVYIKKNFLGFIFYYHNNKSLWPKEVVILPEYKPKQMTASPAEW